MSSAGSAIEDLDDSGARCASDRWGVATPRTKLKAKLSRHVRGNEPTRGIAVAQDAPGPTLVLDLTVPTLTVANQMSVVDLADRARGQAMTLNPELGAKTMAVLDVTGDVIELLFLQGLPDGSVEPAIRVCLNSAACALTVARHHWGLIPDGPLTVHMGDQAFGYEELAG